MPLLHMFYTISWSVIQLWAIYRILEIVYMLFSHKQGYFIEFMHYEIIFCAHLIENLLPESPKHWKYDTKILSQKHDTLHYKFYMLHWTLYATINTVLVLKGNFQKWKKSQKIDLHTLSRKSLQAALRFPEVLSLSFFWQWHLKWFWISLL